MIHRILSNPIYQSDIKQAARVPIAWDKLSGKTILLTGATGMIASAFIDILMYHNRIHHEADVSIPVQFEPAVRSLNKNDRLYLCSTFSIGGIYGFLQPLLCWFSILLIAMLKVLSSIH